MTRSSSRTTHCLPSGSATWACPSAPWRSGSTGPAAAPSLPHRPGHLRRPHLRLRRQAGALHRPRPGEGEALPVHQGRGGLPDAVVDPLRNRYPLDAADGCRHHSEQLLIATAQPARVADEKPLAEEPGVGESPKGRSEGRIQTWVGLPGIRCLRRRLARKAAAAPRIGNGPGTEAGGGDGTKEAMA